jgi:hypothetical protein
MIPSATAACTAAVELFYPIINRIGDPDIPAVVDGYRGGIIELAVTGARVCCGAAGALIASPNR